MNNMKTLHLNCLPFIYKTKLDRKTNENVSESSKTGLSIILRPLLQGRARAPFKCIHFFRCKFEQNLTQFRSSEIQAVEFQLSLTERNSSIYFIFSSEINAYQKQIKVISITIEMI